MRALSCQSLTLMSFWVEQGCRIISNNIAENRPKRVKSQTGQSAPLQSNAEQSKMHTMFSHASKPE